MRPKTTTGWAALILGLLLVVSNAFWIYVTIDNAITASYRDNVLVWNQQALADSLKLIPLLDAGLRKTE